MIPDRLNTDASVASYKTAIRRFRAWWQENGEPGVDRQALTLWKASLIREQLSPRTVNAYLTHVKLAAREALQQGRMDADTVARMDTVRGVPSRGTRVATWLSVDEARDLLDAPDTDTTRGTRDAALLAVMLGAGLRRTEVVSLRRTHIQRHKDRWIIADLRGKGGRTRTIPLPGWTHERIVTWVDHAEINGTPLALRIDRAGDVMTPRRGIHPTSLYTIVRDYARSLDLDCSPHDLRRTYAGLAYDGGADLKQIQYALGHKSITTTEVYLGLRQDLSTAPGDYIQLSLNRS